MEKVSIDHLEPLKIRSTCWIRACVESSGILRRLQRLGNGAVKIKQIFARGTPACCAHGAQHMKPADSKQVILTSFRSQTSRMPPGGMWPSWLTCSPGLPSAGASVAHCEWTSCSMRSNRLPMLVNLELRGPGYIAPIGDLNIPPFAIRTSPPAGIESS